MLQIISGSPFNSNASALLPINNTNKINISSQDDCHFLNTLKNRHFEIMTEPKLGYLERAWDAFNSFLSLPVAQASTIPLACEAPRGSYLKTCTVTNANSYSSSDPHLKDIKFCEYVIDCHALKWDQIKTNRKILTQEDKQCLAKMENCNGKLVLREGNDMLCQDVKVAERYSDVKTDQKEPPKSFMSSIFG